MSYDHLRLSGASRIASEPTADDFKRASGVSNFQFGEAPAATEQRPTGQPTAQRVGGTTRVTTDGKGNMAVENVGVQRASTAAASSVLDTARSTSGSRQASHQVTERSLVVVNVAGREVEMEARSAAAQGYLRRNHDGSFSDADGSTPQATPEHQPEQQQQDQGDGQQQEALSDALEAEVETLATSTSGTDQVALASALLEGRGDAHAAIERMASQAGKPVGEVMETVNAFVAGLASQAEAAVKSVAGNVDFQDWLEQAKESDPEGVQAALRQIAYNRSPAGFKDVARKLVEKADQTDPHEVITACKQANIPARQVGKYVVVRIPGHGEMTYAIALKRGLITAGR